MCSHLQQKIVERNSTVPCKKSQATWTRTLGGPAHPLLMWLSTDGPIIHSRSSVPVTDFSLAHCPCCLMLPLSLFNSPGVLDLLGQPDDRVHSDLRSDLDWQRRRAAQAEERQKRDQETHSIRSLICFSDCSFVLTAPNRGRARSHARQSQTRSAFHCNSSRRDRAPRSCEAESSARSELFCHSHARRALRD